MDIDIKDDDLPFEDEIQREPYKLRGWLRYVDHKSQAPARTLNIIYERAVCQLPGSYKLWKKYLDHRSLQLLKKNPLHFEDEYKKVRLCYERALLHLNKMPRIWLDYLSFITKQPDVTVIRRVFDRALRALPVTQHLKVWPKYLRFAQSVGGLVAVRVYQRYLAVWPDQAERYVDYCVDAQQWDQAAWMLVRILDNVGFRSPRGTTVFQLWKQLAQILKNQPHAVASKGKEASALYERPVDVQGILRDGISRFSSDQVGELWAALASHFIALGQFEMARDVFEEAVVKVNTVRDFSLVFDAYAEFEESTIAVEMEAQVEKVAAGQSGFDLDKDKRAMLLDLRLLRLERLMDRRPFMVSDVVLKQQPHSVQAWLKRVELLKTQEGAHDRVIEIFEKAVATVDPHKATDGKVTDLWKAYAEQLEKDGELDKMRGVLDRAIGSGTPVASVTELADLYVWYAEKELELGQTERALQVLTQATAVPRPVAATFRKIDYRDDTVPVHHRVFKALKVWNLLVDIRESMDDAVDATRAAYDRMLELRIATPQTIVNYAGFLEEHKYFEDSFKAYERGIEAFGYPVAIELWNIYLRRFVDRYGSSKLERSRDLFEQALDKCPDRYAKPIYLAYGKMEESYGGLARRALRIYERATKGVARDQKLEMFQFYAAKTAELLGPVHARAVYERGIEELGDSQALALAIEFAQVERQLGEIDRARALYAYASQFADPRISPQLWSVWHEFEVRHGNEDTFKDMLRVKRSVQARFNTDAQFLAALEIEKQKQRNDGGSSSGTKVEGFERQKQDTVHTRKEQQEETTGRADGAENPDEVNIDFDDDL
ncbi:pre-mRNA-splicing factor syf1 [Coemansia sp. RSA 1813]|nr:pre-mRNA-splicing factor syf1 [Coemansia sp. RSA 1843]KAJ2086545.1 pre-mRNA-splicing factor syf1 [Coemansia sp. RSA 986]KAJ2211888.1 pre-mRNA-splicing factor syf1 [Coemansia sp. RSA 487]KAJ2564873.1 pre-mRNA-splicing factor syf1 [Coemansia sp. RSA 1813]